MGKNPESILLCLHTPPLSMIIAVTGTPGTGKTSVSEKLDWPVIDLTRFVRGNSLGHSGEDEFEVDIEQMVDELREEVKGYDNVVIEGHLAHRFPADYCVVLRCRPDTLEKRLQGRDYSTSKVKENVDSETLDIILSEAVEKQENVIEVETTDRDLEKVAEEIEKRIKDDETGYGDIDWSKFI